MTTEELFNKICTILEAKGKIPDILDYRLATSHPVPIKTHEFDLKNNLAYGGSEGIYLDLWINHFADGEWHVSELGTFKTLDESDAGMYIMAALLADFVMEGTAYANANLDDLTWEGADVYMLDGNGERLNGGYSCRSMERAMVQKDELLKKYPVVVIRDNATRRETYFHAHGENVTG